MEERCAIAKRRFQDMVDLKASIVETYGHWANTYEEDMVVYGSNGYYHAAKAAHEHCPSSPEDVAVLDVGCGTGRVADELKMRGFKCVDGIDPASQMIERARAKGLYRNLYCDFFTKTALNIPDNSYDMIVTSGAFIPGHLPCDCLYEMIRLVKPGGIICIVTRKDSFTLESEYKEGLVSVMKELELSGRWRKLKMQNFVNYSVCHEGMLAVYRVS